MASKCALLNQSLAYLHVTVGECRILLSSEVYWLRGFKYILKGNYSADINIPVFTEPDLKLWPLNPNLSVFNSVFTTVLSFILVSIPTILPTVFPCLSPPKVSYINEKFCFKYCYSSFIGKRDSVIGTTNRLRARRSGFQSWQKQQSFLFLEMSGLALGPNQLHHHCVLWFFPMVKLVGMWYFATCRLPSST